MALHLIFAAMTPLIAVFGLLVVARMPAARAMPLSLALTAIVGVTAWRMPLRQVLAAIAEGTVIAASILWIIFGAILLLKVLTASGAMATIRVGFTRITPDPRAQIVVISWLFGAFLEGAAGFGTPAAITAPMLVALGFTPISSVVLALVADSSPVTFGAIGTPVQIGLAEGLQTGANFSPIALEAMGGRTAATFLQDVAVQAAAIDIVVGSLIPLVLIVMYSRFFSQSRSWAYGFAAWRFALFAGLAYTVPAYGAARWLGPELPALLGSLLGLACVIPIALKGWMLPACSIPDRHVVHADEPAIDMLALARAWLPYLLLAFLLIATRTEYLPLKAWLLGLAVSWDGIFGTEIGVTVAPLYLPGAIFVAVVLVTFPLQRLNSRATGQVLRETWSTVLKSAWALGAAVPMVRIFIQSDVNSAGLGSMPMELARLASDALGTAYPLVAPLVGALGSFLSGSATFSNMTFAQFQATAASEAGLSAKIVLAGQMLGANAGNMVSVLNVVAAAAVVGLLRKEGTIIRYTLVPMLGYALLSGMIVFLLTTAS